MTNSSNSFQNNKLVIFHGLNNNPQGFEQLCEEFRARGFMVEMVILPCHGDKRDEASNDREALRVFSEKMKQFEGQDYVAIAFSHGALYLQLWLEKNLPHKPKRQVLLAPALAIRKQALIVKALAVIPPAMHIMSLQPKVFRRYNTLSAREYSILVQGILTWQKLRAKLRIPSLVLIDPKDELVDAQKLREQYPVTEFLERPYLKKGLGAHHILFHPDYFERDEWQKLISKIDSFLKDT